MSSVRIRVYKLLNGRELLATTDATALRKAPDREPCEVDGDEIIFDVLALLDKTIEERDRLRKELEEERQGMTYETKQADMLNELYMGSQKELKAERKRAEAVRKAMQDVLYYLQRDSYIPAQDILEQYLALGQEGEGNQEEMRHLTPEESESYERSLDKLFNQK